MNTAIHNNVKLWLLLAAALSVAISAAGTVAGHDSTSGAADTSEMSAAATATGMPCKRREGMWGDPDPNIFYICDSGDTNTAQRRRCPEGRGFFDGLGYYGCLPFEEWPACIGAAAATGGDDSRLEPPSCDEEHLLAPWDTADPNQFYMCLATDLEPLLANCEPGRGFVNAATNREGRRIVGCAQWEKWRSYMHCEDYY